MTFRITVTWHNAGPHTVWGKLAERLGRGPTNEEAMAEVKRIFEEATVERASKGQLWFQK